jgi:hypothetical protein
MKGKPTPQQRKRFREFIRQGYSIAIVLPDGSLCPGYADYMIEFVLDELEQDILARTNDTPIQVPINRPDK